MTWSPSDTKLFRFLGSVPRWVWILLFVITLLTRVWILIALGAFIVFVFVILTIVGIIAFEEMLDDDGPGHRGNKPGIFEWLQR